MSVDRIATTSLYVKPITRLHVLVDLACSNGGVSERYDYLLLYRSHVTPDQVEPEKLDKAVVVGSIRGHSVHVRPLVAPPAGHLGWMAGGSYVTGDSNFTAEILRATGIHFSGAASLHDRSETQRQYNELSR